jgi:hypothetical protein
MVMGNSPLSALSTAIPPGAARSGDAHCDPHYLSMMHKGIAEQQVAQHEVSPWCSKAALVTASCAAGKPAEHYDILRPQQGGWLLQ